MVFQNVTIITFYFHWHITQLILRNTFTLGIHTGNKLAFKVFVSLNSIFKQIRTFNLIRCIILGSKTNGFGLHPKIYILRDKDSRSAGVFFFHISGNGYNMMIFGFLKKHGFHFF